MTQECVMTLTEDHKFKFKVTVLQPRWKDEDAAPEKKNVTWGITCHDIGYGRAAGLPGPKLIHSQAKIKYMAVGTGGPGGGGGLAPPLFRDAKKFQWWKCNWMMQIGCKIWFFLENFNFRLASLAFLIIKQLFKNQYYLTKMFIKTCL